MKFLIPLVIAASSLSAQQIFLDSVMSKEEQRKTGIYKLSTTQKIELENWLNQNFVLKTKTATASTSENLSLSINIDNGKRLELSDNSTWEIAPNDVLRASAWITPFPVKISPSNDPAYPYLITNSISGDSVKARPWKEPSTPQTPG